MAPTAESVHETVQVIRVAASKRAFLLGLRWYVALFMVYYALRWLKLLAVELADSVALGTYFLLLGTYVWFERWASVWIELEGSIVRVRTRRPFDFIRPTRHNRGRGRVLTEYEASSHVRYEPRSSLWRVDTALWIGPDRFSVYPEGRTLAAELVQKQSR